MKGKRTDFCECSSESCIANYNFGHERESSNEMHDDWRTEVDERSKNTF